MAMQNQLSGEKKQSLTGIKAFNNLVGSSIMKTKIHQMVGKIDSQEFITSITSAVNNNPSLAECEAQSIISAALLGQSLHLKPSPQLGYFYMVPFNNKKKGCKEAQFQIGYKGYLQLAIRTGEYIDIDAIEIREGEYKGRNRLTGKPEFEFVDDDTVRENLPVVGYMAYFEMKNGYIKRLYWSKEKMEKHADEFSQAFKLDKYKELQDGKMPATEQWKYSSFWYKDFDVMANKTMLRQLLSKHALLSTEMQKAVESDMAVIKEDMSPEYIDVPTKEVEETVIGNTPITTQEVIAQMDNEMGLVEEDPMA